MSSPLILRVLILGAAILILPACSDKSQLWKIGGDQPTKKLTLIDSQDEQTIKVCLHEKGGSGYPITLVIDHDDEKYAGVLLGQCLRFEAKKVVVRFGTPSAFKFANGSYEILDS